MKSLANTLIVFLLSAGIASAQMSISITSQVSSSADDAEEMGSNGSTPGTMDLASSDLELVRDGSDGDQYVGMRFTGLNIPQGATITNAWIQFTVDETDAQTGDKYIWTEAADNATGFTPTAFNISNRPRSADTVTWSNIPNWNTVGAAGPDQQTPDLSSIVQEVVNRTGWTQGNAMVFLIHGTGERVAEAFDGDAASAPVLHVTYSSSNYVPGGFPLLTGSAWKYEDSGTDLGTGWRAPSYVDTAWAFGPAILGYGNGNESTTLDFGGNASSKHPTYYLRNSFITGDVSAYDSLDFRVLRDDGVVVYVNGTEAFRMNMPGGPVTYSTLASTTVGGADETTYFVQRVPNTLLSNDTNHIAVELHQSALNSSDLSFDLGIEGVLGPFPIDTFPILSGSNWMLLDTGANLDALPWTGTSYNSSTWQWGPAPLGYSDPIINTEVSFGPNPNNKFITTYFRKEFYIPNVNNIRDSLLLKLMRDDGAVVYINGTEVARSNMPTPPTNFQTLASTTVGGSDETTFFSFLIENPPLVNGTNVIAVEIHQRDGTSSDKIFDLALDEFLLPAPGSCPNGDQNHIGCFTSLPANGQSNNLEIPSTHAFQMLIQQNDPYSVGPGNLPGNNDFTGYVPINGSSRNGYLSINHENTPGGVTMLTMHFDSTTYLWSVDSSQAIDFSPVVLTTRNCSGGITPWGTVITSEETFNSGDLNNDGYEDVGWHVEIDPVSKSVMDYGNGPEKLWAMGRMAHENVVVVDDSVTAYYGEDGGTSCVYKFVADVPGNLSSGSLYVLAVDSGLDPLGDPIGTTAHWISVPNTTQNDRNNANSLASALGGTSFFGVEDVEIHPLTGQIYFTSKNNGRTYRFTDLGTTITGFSTFLGGESYAMYTQNGLQFEPWGIGNDNLAFDDLGNLWVMQDGDNDYIWVVRPDHTPQNPHVELFGRSPFGSEPTGITFSPDHRYLFLSIQHPSAVLNTPQTDASGASVTFNLSSTVVISRDDFLGASAQAPVADFVADTTLISVGDTVNYTDLSLFNPSSRQWTFPGGTPGTSTATAPVVVYNMAGSYDASLIVGNANGNDTLLRPAYIVGMPAANADPLALPSHSIKVFPNPVSDGALNVDLDLPTPASNLRIELFDLQGRLLHTLHESNRDIKKGKLVFDLQGLGISPQQVLLKIRAEGWETSKLIQILR